MSTTLLLVRLYLVLMTMFKRQAVCIFASKIYKMKLAHYVLILGQSVFRDPVSRKDVIVYHYIPKSAPVGSDSFFLGINYLDFTSGWPVLVD